MTTSLRTRFSILIIILAIMPQILTGVLLANLASNSLEEQSLTLQQEIAANVGHQVEAFILDAERELILLDKVFGLRTLDKVSQQKVLNSVLLNNRNYFELTLLDKVGREQIHLSSSTVVLESALQLRDDELEYLIPVNEKSTFFGPVEFDNTTNEPLAKIAVPIVNPQSGEVAFVLVATIRYKPVWDLLSDLELPNQLEVYVVDNGGRVVAHPNPTVVLRDTRIDISKIDGRNLGLSGKDSILGSYSLLFGQQELFVIAQQPISSSLRLAIRFLQVTTGIMAVSLLAALGLIVFATRQIIVPIETLASTVQAISTGELTRQASVIGHDEIGRLALAFNRMTHQLSTMINTLELRVEERTQDLKEALILQKESEELYRSLIELSPDGISVTDHKGILIMVNQQAVNLHGFDKADEMIGMNSLELVAPEYREYVEQQAKDAMSSGISGHFEYALRRKDGSTFPAEASATFILGPNDIPNQVITIFRDITKRKQIEDALFEEKERAEITLHSIGDAVIATDIHARIEYINPVAENLTGWKIDEAIGKPLEQVFRIIEEGSRQSAISPVERCLAEGKVVGLANHSILISRSGREYSIDDSAAPIRNQQGTVIGVVLVFHDVTEARRLSQKLEHDAVHDSLTGLVNRREFERRLERALISSKQHGLFHMLCYLDLDQFKIVNDTAGHMAGDELLKQIASMMNGLFRDRDTFARLGGDEFGLLLENCQLDQALVISNDILAKIRNYPFIWAGRSFQVGVSIGVVLINEETESVAQVLSQADIACYSAKDLGRNRVHVYQSEDSETAKRQNEVIQVSRIREALDHNLFTLYCQPIARLTMEGNEIIQYEILLRMKDGEEHLVFPGAFIPSAERYGLMPSIDRWVIRETFLTMVKYSVQGAQITINLSGNSLDDETLLEYVLGQLDEFSVQPAQICFEITETAAIRHLNKAQQFIQAFRKLGGKIALDDFGSGFSSFRYLKSLSVDYIKIDGGFVNDMLSNPENLVMVEAITQIAHTLGMEVVAEHASNLEIIDRLSEIGADHAQGYGIGHPIPVEAVWGDKL
jgi:diguanylate cyclase (GGDEF)-like protein/PAS domain S-box-containing protein